MLSGIKPLLDQDLCYHMGSLDHSESNGIFFLLFSSAISLNFHWNCLNDKSWFLLGWGLHNLYHDKYVFTMKIDCLRWENMHKPLHNIIWLPSMSFFSDQSICFSEGCGLLAGDLDLWPWDTRPGSTLSHTEQCFVFTTNVDMDCGSSGSEKKMSRKDF